MTRCTWTKIEAPTLEFRADRVHAPEFGDSYFQPIAEPDGDPGTHRAANVFAEAEYTFIHGNQLAERWIADPRQQFCVAEMGLGTGANLAATLEFWQNQSKRPGRMDYLAFEARPLSIEQLTLSQALQGFDGQALVNALSADPLYPLPGVTRHELVPGFWLTLVLGDVEQTLDWFEDCLVDACYLDGFAPARNQAMWSDPTLDQIARMTRPGGTFATFTAASAVRRGLETAGFNVSKTAGFGPKRERLIGAKPGRWEESKAPSRVTIAGAGVMGCWAAKAARQAGLDVELNDPAGRLNGSGSGVPVPAIDWRPTLDFMANGRLAFTSFIWAARAYRAQYRDACAPGPLTQLEPRIWPTFAHWGFPEPEIAEAHGWAVDGPLHELAGTIQLDRAELFKDVEVVTQPAPQHASLLVMGHKGSHTNSTIRGQQSLFVANSALPSRPLKAGKLAGPTVSGELFLGSSFQRDHGDDWHLVQDADDAEAWEQFQGTSTLGHVERTAKEQWAGLRAVSIDRLPNYVMGLNGQVSINCLGSHGFTFAPLLAEQWVSDLCGAPNVIDRELLDRMGRGTRNAK